MQEEAVPESLKNILLVMSNGGYLVPPEEEPKKKLLWEETWKRLDRFLPEMYREIYPEPREEPEKVSVEGKDESDKPASGGQNQGHAEKPKETERGIS